MAVPVVWRHVLGERLPEGQGSAAGAMPSGPGGWRLLDWAVEWTPRWLELHRRVFVPPGRPAWTPARFAQEFTDCPWWRPDRLVLVCVDDRLVGTVAWVGPVAPVMAMNWLAVDPAWRGRGIGRALVVEAERRLAAAGAREVRLTTLDAWRPAGQLYRKLGYQPVAELPPEVFEG